MRAKRLLRETVTVEAYLISITQSISILFVYLSSLNKIRFGRVEINTIYWPEWSRADRSAILHALSRLVSYPPWSNSSGNRSALVRAQICLLNSVTLLRAIFSAGVQRSGNGDLVFAILRILRIIFDDSLYQTVSLEVDTFRTISALYLNISY